MSVLNSTSGISAYVNVICFMIVVLVAVMTYLWRLPKMKGLVGELTVRRRLGYLDRNKYKLIHDVTLRTKTGKLSQIDHIVVSPYGVFVIETKNYSGKIYGNEHMAEWVQYFGKRKVTLYSPVKQNNGHVLALKGLLGADVKVVSVIAFSKRADLHVTVKTAEVVYIDALAKSIKQYQELFISSAHVEEIVEKITTSSLRGKDVRREHFEQVQRVTTERLSNADRFRDKKSTKTDKTDY